MPPDFPPIFIQLSAILRRNAGKLAVTQDTPTHFCLAGGRHPRHKTPMPVAWTLINKNYVSYHLMPVYGCPRLLETLSPELAARMQGKSCFNFKTADATLFLELEQLTRTSFAAFKKAGFMP